MKSLKFGEYICFVSFVVAVFVVDSYAGDSYYPLDKDVSWVYNISAKDSKATP